MTCSPASTPLCVPRLRDKALPFDDLPYRQWARDRKRFWKHKMEQAEGDYRPDQEIIPLVDVLAITPTGAVWL